MDEAHFKEIEKVFLYLSEARERAERGANAIRKDGAEPHLVEALEWLETELKELHRLLIHKTYYAVPEAAPKQEELVGDDRADGEHLAA